MALMTSIQLAVFFDGMPLHYRVFIASDTKVMDDCFWKIYGISIWFDMIIFFYNTGWYIQPQLLCHHNRHFYPNPPDASCRACCLLPRSCFPRPSAMDRALCVRSTSLVPVAGGGPRVALQGQLDRWPGETRKDDSRWPFKCLKVSISIINICPLKRSLVCGKSAIISRNPEKSLQHVAQHVVTSPIFQQKTSHFSSPVHLLWVPIISRPRPILLEKWAAYCNGRAPSQQAKIIEDLGDGVKPVTCGTVVILDKI